MRIQHNITAMNSLTNYSSNTKTLSGNLEKLSSGYRINSAADDAAGLGISEKMRAQIAGLDKAQANCNDGISLVQTAEGALTEVNSMLTRMTELATQSANGTYDDSVDRVNLQQEVENLMDEMDRIAKSNNFNGVTLLDGSLSGKSQVSNLGISTSKALQGQWSLGAAFSTSVDLSGLKTEDVGKSIDYTVTWQDAKGQEQTTTVSLTFQGYPGDGSGQVSTATANNFFTDDQGNKYNLANDGTLSAKQFQEAVMKGLQADTDFSANFNVAASGTTDLTFTAINAGSGQATIVTTGAKPSKLSIGTTTAMGGSGTVKTQQKALDSVQKFAAGSVGVATSIMDANKLASNVFEIDGEKFLVGNDLTDKQRSLIDSDVHLIEIGETSVTQDESISKIASEISRVTGLTTEVADANNTEANITKNDIMFTEDTLRINDKGKGLTLQIGDTSDSYQMVTVEIDDMSSKGLGLTGIDIGTQEGAQTAVDVIKNAINTVSLQRGNLGALQNRLDHTLNSLAATDENISASESQIRDVDMAEEMTKYSKNNVLVQSAQSMLAQANSLPQGVLQLLS